MSRIILEGGAAAAAMIDKKLSQHPDNQGRELQYGKITDADLDSIFPREYGPLADVADDTYIGRIFHTLGSQGLIDPSYAPSYKMGSTRLAALKKYGQDSIELDRYETDDIIAAVSGKKTEYGDLDIDVIFRGDKKEIAAAIEAIDPATYAASGVGAATVFVAIRIGEKVIQVDLVDVSEGKDAQDFLHKSSFVDLDRGIKGAFSIILLRAAAAVMEIGPKDTLDSLVAYAQENPDTPFAKDLNKKLKLNYQPVGTRFSLGAKGLKLVVDLEKPSRKDPNKKTQAKIDFDQAVRRGYEDLDGLAKVILQDDRADSSTIYSASKLAEFIGQNMSQDRINLIWSAMVDSAEKNLKRKIGQEEYDVGMSYIADAFGTEWVPEHASQLNEAREAIGRFLGKSKFSNVNMISLLRALVEETGNEGNTKFTINLGTSPAVDMVEKMDSSFSHFGIDQKGKFFMETSNSGPVTADTVEQKFGTNPEFFHDIYQSFKWLQNSKKFQAALNEIYNEVGPIRYDAEILPVLTHEGDSDGNIVFVGTPYSREKLGNAGTFVVFKAQRWNPDELTWYRPSPKENVSLTNMIKNKTSGVSKEWNVYTNEQDMKHNVNLQVEFDQLLANYLSSEDSFNQAVGILSSRKKSAEKEQLVSSLDLVRETLQDKLNTYASNAKSVLGDENSYIEGVVLRVKKSNGDIFEAKGTSYKFDEHKEKLWKDRVDIANLYNDFEKSLLIDVLGLRTSHPATLNKAIKQVSAEFTPTAAGDKAKAQFVQELIPVVSDKKEGFGEVKTLAPPLLSDTETQLEQLKAQLEENRPNLDVDSVRKTIALYDAIAEKLGSFKSVVNATLDGFPYYVNLLGFVLDRRISRFVNFGRTKPREKKEDRKKVILWNGRAQPWHKGHDAMVQKGKVLLKKLGADAVMVMIVKGGKTSKDKATNPLSESEQISLISSVYEGDPRVIVSDVVPKSSFIGEIADSVYKTGFEVAGWLAGADRIDDYRLSLKTFNPEMWEQDHSYSPFDVNDFGQSTVKMIETPRVMSGTEARELAKSNDFATWVKNVAPQNISDKTIEIYRKIYLTLGGVDDTDGQEPTKNEQFGLPEVLSMLDSHLEEMSAASGGAVGGFSSPLDDEEDNYEMQETSTGLRTDFHMQDKDDDLYVGLPAKAREYLKGYLERPGYPVFSRKQKAKFIKKWKLKNEIAPPMSVAAGSMGAKRDDDMERKQFIEEMRLRKFIKKAIKLRESKRQREKALGENRLRSIIRKMLVEATENAPHESTGINVLEDLLKKIVPILEQDYKSLTTSPTQRESFRAHVINAVQNTLAPRNLAGDEDVVMSEDEVDIDILPKDGEEKFIDIDGDGVADKAEEDEDTFSIPGEDETGRNVALQSFDKVEKQIVEAYGILSNEKDQAVFYDYLITNLKLYFDKFEDELKTMVVEPDSESYQDQKGGMEAEDDELDLTV